MEYYLILIMTFFFQFLKKEKFKEISYRMNYIGSSDDKIDSEFINIKYYARLLSRIRDLRFSQSFYCIQK